MWTAPAFAAPASSSMAPTAMSGTPSRSKSPMPARDEPNRSLDAIDGPLAVEALIFTARFVEPSELR